MTYEQAFTAIESSLSNTMLSASGADQNAALLTYFFEFVC